MWDLECSNTRPVSVSGMPRKRSPDSALDTELGTKPRRDKIIIIIP